MNDLCSNRNVESKLLGKYSFVWIHDTNRPNKFFVNQFIFYFEADVKHV